MYHAYKEYAGFVSQAIKYFRQQDYPNKELIIVDNGQDLVGDLVPQDSDIHYRTAERSLAIGDLRNRAIEESHGNIIAHWDDDDWYGRTRLSQQINPILNGHADLTGLNLQIVYDMSNKQFWAMEELAPYTDHRP